MKQRFIHIGYPKCASTSLQTDYLAVHPEIYHLGWGCPHTPSGWVDDDVAAAMEVDLRMAKMPQYHGETTWGVLCNHFALAERKEQYGAIGLSWESLCFSLVNDVDAFTKASRLFDIFGNGAKIIVVIRNQLELIRSMYLEMVRGGMSKTFEEYLEYLYFYRFTGLTTDLFYSDILTIYGDLFRYENLMIMTLEDVERRPAFELYRISDFLGISNAVEEMTRRNASVDLRILEHIRRINEKRPHNFGSSYFSPIDPEKLVPYWRREGLAPPPTALYALDGRAKHLEQAMFDVTDECPPIDVEFSPMWRDRFSALYAPSNRIVQQHWKIDLAAKGYPV